MTLKTTLGRAKDALDSILGGINSSPDPGYIEIWTGAPKASLATAEDTVLLSTCAIADGTVAAFAATPGTAPQTAVGHLAGGIFAVDTSIVATGTAGHFRLYDSVGSPVLQGTVGTSGADLILDSVALVLGGTVTITQFDVTIVAGA